MPEYTGEPILLETPCLDSEGNVVYAPAVPAPPALTKDCAIGLIAVAISAFPDTANLVRVRRRALPDGAWATVHAFGEAGDWEDVPPGGYEYEYSAQACNEAGCSAWSDAASVSLVSETLTTEWLTPEPDAELSNKTTLRFTLTDAGETLNDCGDPVVLDGCADPQISLWLDGIELLTVPALVSGTLFNGEYSALLDTRDFASGERVLKVLATGTDCCHARASVPVNIENTLRRGVLYTQLDYMFAPPSGQEYQQAEISLQNEALNGNPARRYWIKSGLTAGAPFSVFDVAATDDDKAEAFDALQAVTLETAQIGTTPERTQLFAAPLLAPPGAAVHWVQQWTPEQFLSFHLTGCERVAKLRDVGASAESDGEYFVFADSPTSGDAAKVFSYELGVLTELVDLADHDAANATDAARQGDKVFVVAPLQPDGLGSELFAVDLDTGQSTLNLAPRGETRTPRFVENVDGTIIALFVDAALSEERTRAYDMTFAAPRLLWTLDAAATRVYPSGAALAVACGAEYYSTADAATAPALRHTFAANIVAMDEPRVRLQTGAIWRDDGAAWIQEVASGTMGAGAIAAWEGTSAGGAGETGLGVSGGASAQLLEEISAGQWIDGRTIAPAVGMTETIGAIVALARYEKIIASESGEPGQPDYRPAVSRLALLIGTAPDGVLAVLELSTLGPEQGAFNGSRVSHLNIDAYGAPIPAD